MAYRGTKHNGPMSNTVQVQRDSINLYIKEQVRPMFDSWENDIRNFIVSRKNMPSEEQRNKLCDIISRMITQTNRHKSTFRVRVSKAVYTELPPKTTISEQMLTMTCVWKNKLKEKKSPPKNYHEIPDQRLVELLCEMDGQLSYWMHYLTQGGTKQKHRGTGVEQYSGKDGQRQQNHPLHSQQTGGQQQSTSQHPTDAQLTEDERKMLQDEINRLQMKYDSKVAEHREKESQQNDEMERLQKKIEQQRGELNAQTKDNYKVAREKDEALNRLSEIAGQKMRQNNPAIVDLSTENRPTKIAERLTELYSNQWTEAFLELTTGYTDIEVINFLLRSLEESFDFTKRISDMQLKQLKQSAQMLGSMEQSNAPEYETAVENNQGAMAKTTPPARYVSTPSGTKVNQQQTLQLVPLTQECEDLVKQLLKASSPGFVHEVQERFVRERLAKLQGKYDGKAMIDFYKECAAITWYMNVQTPPLVFAPKPEKESPINNDLYSLYTQSGKKVEYVVWPACLLHEGGPLLSKGILQPFKIEGGKDVAPTGRRNTPENDSNGERKPFTDQNNVNFPSNGRNGADGNVRDTKV